MSYCTKQTTVIDRIKHDFGMDVVPFLEKNRDNGMKLEDIANMIDCSTSNLRRIIRSFRFTFIIPEPTPMLKNCPTFQNKKMNAENYLSRRWVA